MQQGLGLEPTRAARCGSQGSQVKRSYKPIGQERMTAVTNNAICMKQGRALFGLNR